MWPEGSHGATCRPCRAYVRGRAIRMWPAGIRARRAHVARGHPCVADSDRAANCGALLAEAPELGRSACGPRGQPCTAGAGNRVRRERSIPSTVCLTPVSAAPTLPNLSMRHARWHDPSSQHSCAVTLARLATGILFAPTPALDTPTTPPSSVFPCIIFVALVFCSGLGCT